MNKDSYVIQPHPVIEELHFPKNNLKADICKEIVKRIEEVRDKDKNAGEYPYNRCIDIVKEVME